MDDSLVTQRLHLRPLEQSDAPAMAALLGGDGEALRMTERLPEDLDEAAARAWIESRQGPGQTAFAMTLRKTGAMVGAIGFFRDGATAGMGYWVGRAHWGCGYATEAGQALLAVARDSGVCRILADCFPSNRASQRVLAKLGFTFEDELTKHIPVRGGQVTLYRYGRKL